MRWRLRPFADALVRLLTSSPCKRRTVNSAQNLAPQLYPIGALRLLTSKICTVIVQPVYMKSVCLTAETVFDDNDTDVAGNLRYWVVMVQKSGRCKSDNLAV